MTDQITTSRADEDDTWVELPGSEDFEHDGEPVGSDDDLDELGYDPGDDPASQPPPVPPPPAPDGGGRGDNLKFPVSKAAIPSCMGPGGSRSSSRPSSSSGSDVSASGYWSRNESRGYALTAATARPC